MRLRWNAKSGDPTISFGWSFQPLILCRTSIERRRHSVERLPFDLIALMLAERDALGAVKDGRELFT